MCFNVKKVPEPEIIDIDGDPYEELEYAGNTADSLFHTAGYLLTQFGLFDGDPLTLRQLTVKAIARLAENGFASRIRDFVAFRWGGMTLEKYLSLMTVPGMQGDLLCVAAIERHFGIRIHLFCDRKPWEAERPVPPPATGDRAYINYTVHSAEPLSYFSPLRYHELPALIADNYCLSCGVGVPHPEEVICSDCISQPRFCVHCRFTYVEQPNAVCPHCVEKLKATLVDLGSSRPSKAYDSSSLSCMKPPPSVLHASPVVEEKALPQFVVYLSNAPFDDFRSGDGTYMNSIVRWIRDRKMLAHNGKTYAVKAYRLCDTAIAARRPAEDRDMPLIEIPYIVKWPTSKEETEKMSMKDWEKYYGPARHMIYSELCALRQKDTHPDSIHIFHLQSRYPDSGALYNKGFLEGLKKAGFRVVLTCHEMKFNYLNLDNTQRSVVQLNEYASVADRTIFLNAHDLFNGVKLIKLGSLSAYLKRKEQRKKEKGQTRLEVYTVTQKILKEIEKTTTSDIHPSGAFVDTITAPPSVTAHFFHIPGIATVAGKAFTVEEILRRDRNLLVFGLIKQSTAMQKTVDLARELNKHVDLVKEKGMCVIVAGKVFKDYKHEALATLVGGACGYSKKDLRELEKFYDEMARRYETETAFNADLNPEIARRIEQSRVAWRQTITEFAKAVNEPYCKAAYDASVNALKAIPLCRKYDEEIGKLALEVEAYIARAGLFIGENYSYAEIELVLEEFQHIENTLQRINRMFKGYIRTLEDQATLKEAVEKERTAFGQHYQAMQQKIRELRKYLGRQNDVSPDREPLPIRVMIDVPPDAFQVLATTCKYAFKVDQKSMADNASSIISLMANGCIVFTESKFDTPDEFRSDKGGRLCPVIMPANKYGTCDGAFVVQELTKRETEDNETSNRETLKIMKTLLVKRYGLDEVADQHMRVYLTLLDEK